MRLRFWRRRAEVASREEALNAIHDLESDKAKLDEYDSHPNGDSRAPFNSVAYPNWDPTRF